MNGYFNSIIELALSVWAFLIKPKPSELAVELPAPASPDAVKRPQTSPRNTVIIEHDFRAKTASTLPNLFLPDLEPPADKPGMDASEYTALAA